MSSHQAAQRQRQRAAEELLVFGLALLARQDARLRPMYGAAATASDSLSLLEAAGEAVSTIATLRYSENSRNAK